MFLVDTARPHVAEHLQDIAEWGELWDITGWSTERVCRRAVELAPAGVVTFSEFQQRLTAAIAHACGLVGHRPDTVELLVDKYAQRAALAAGGVQATRCVLIRAGDDPPSEPYPAVLKPRHGAGSVDTCQVDSPAAAAAALAAFDAGRDFVLEELLVGDPSAAGPDWGDYVSVESVVRGGVAATVSVTGKLPLIEPFRETGHLLPPTISEGLAYEVVRLEQAALKALGVTDGITHTEIKFTSDGPRIIEVNGRMGGLINDVVARAYGYDLTRAGIQVALGRPADEPCRVARTVAYQRFVMAPRHANKVRTTAPLEAIGDLSGVVRVDLHVRPGDRVDWRTGLTGWLAVVYGEAPDHATMRSRVAEIDTLAAAAYP